MFAIHVHENNGQLDEHKELNEASWCFEVIGREGFRDLPIVLETFGLTIERIVQQVDLLESLGQSI